MFTISICRTGQLTGHISEGIIACGVAGPGVVVYVGEEGVGRVVRGRPRPGGGGGCFSLTECPGCLY